MCRRRRRPTLVSCRANRATGIEDRMVPTGMNAVASDSATSARRRIASVFSAAGRAEFWIALVAVGLVLLQANHPYVESVFVWRAVPHMTFRVADGPSPAIPFPNTRPSHQRPAYLPLPS